MTRDTEKVVPLDLTAEAEIADDAAEELAVDSSSDGDREVTPTAIETCGECGGGPERQPLIRFRHDMPPPNGPAEAWALRDYTGKYLCVATSEWSWCFRTCYFTGKLRVKWDRRSTLRDDDDAIPGPVRWKRKPEA